MSVKKIAFIGPKADNLFKAPKQSNLELYAFKYHNAYRALHNQSVISTDSKENYNRWLMEYEYAKSNTPEGQRFYRDPKSPYTHIYNETVKNLLRELDNIGDNSLEVHFGDNTGVETISHLAAHDVKEFIKTSPQYQGLTDKFKIVMHPSSAEKNRPYMPGFKTRDVDMERVASSLDRRFRGFDNSKHRQFVNLLEKKADVVAKDFYKSPDYRKAVGFVPGYVQGQKASPEYYQGMKEKNDASIAVKRFVHDIVIDSVDEVYAVSNGYIYNNDDVTNNMKHALENGKRINLINSDRIQEQVAQRTGLQPTDSAKESLKAELLFNHLSPKHYQNNYFDYKAQWYEKDYEVRDWNYTNKLVDPDIQKEQEKRLSYLAHPDYNYYNKYKMSGLEYTEYDNTNNSLAVFGSMSVGHISNDLRERLDQAMENNWDILVKDNRGTDHHVIQYCASKEYPNVKVYTIFDDAKLDLHQGWEVRRIPMPTTEISDWVTANMAPTKEAQAVRSTYMTHDATESYVVWNPTTKSNGHITDSVNIDNAMRSVLLNKPVHLENMATQSLANLSSVEDLKHEVLSTPDRVVVDLPFETAWHKLPSDVRDASTNAQGQIDDIEIRNVLGNVSAPILSDDDFIAMEFGLTI